MEVEDQLSGQVLELYTISFGSPAEPHERHIAKLMRCHFYRVFVMVNEDGIVIACAFVLELSKSQVYHVDYFCVRPGLRGNGVGTKFFQALADLFQQEGRFPFLTLESETRMVPYYLKQACVDLHIQSDHYEELKWFLLMKPLSCDLPPDLTESSIFSLETADHSSTFSSPLQSTMGAVLRGVVVELKNVLADAALFPPQEAA